MPFCAMRSRYPCVMMVLPAPTQDARRIAGDCVWQGTHRRIPPAIPAMGTPHPPHPCIEVLDLWINREEHAHQLIPLLWCQCVEPRSASLEAQLKHAPGRSCSHLWRSATVHAADGATTDRIRTAWHPVPAMGAAGLGPLHPAHAGHPAARGISRTGSAGTTARSSSSSRWST